MDEPTVTWVEALPTKRDYGFEAICDATGREMAELTPSERGITNRALREIRTVCRESLLVEEIYRRAANWAVLYPHMKLTPAALARNWAALKDVSPPQTTISQRLAAQARKGVQDAGR